MHHTSDTQVKQSTRHSNGTSIISTDSPVWHQLDITQTAGQLSVDLAQGLPEDEAAERRRQYGPNELEDKGIKSPWRILWEQFTATMVLILIAAALLSAYLAKWLEAGSILGIVLLFGLLGFFQEYRAEQAMAALKKLAVPNVRIRRNGKAIESSASELVPGDVVLLEAGNLVPADLRLVDAANLRIQEAALTGESEPVEKSLAQLERADLPLGDRVNMAYMGTVVTYGRGAGVVTQTGMSTELGRIASLLQSTGSEMTPLQRRLDTVGKQLAAGGIIVAILILIIGILRAEPVEDMLLTAISVAVAVVPEGLPAVVTFTLALGAQRMLRRNALIRKLPAVETLGSVTTICSDKTGTLTENRMTVTVIDIAGHRIDLDEDMLRSMPLIDDSELEPDAIGSQALPMKLTLLGGALCNDSEIRRNPEDGRLHTLGDPTEAALLVVAARYGLNKNAVQRQMPRLLELPFDSDRKRMTTVHQQPAADGALGQLIAHPLFEGNPVVAITKGSTDGLLTISNQIWVDGEILPVDEAWRTRIQSAADRLAINGMRVLGIALRPFSALPEVKELEQDLIFIGLVGMIDPPRGEVKQAVAIARKAGIRPIMITGDHPLTAAAIARELGIGGEQAANGSQVVTGAQINQMSAEELLESVRTCSVYARVSPEHKLRIVEALQKLGQVVAMTGDGVNDAPALKRANIGVAMGITGTDVSKEASDMVLLDDNFATIVAAVEEGRTIYDNVRRFVKFSVAGNIGKVMVMLLAPLFGINVALLPLQLLWLNLLTDGLLGLGMGVEPAEKRIMKRPPRSPQADIFSEGVGLHVIWVGLLSGALALGVGAWAYNAGLPNWQSYIFLLLAFLQIGQALASRSMRESTFRMPLTANPLLAILVLVVLGLQIGAVTLPPLEAFLGTSFLNLTEILILLAIGSAVFIGVEVEKAILRRREA